MSRGGFGWLRLLFLDYDHLAGVHFIDQCRETEDWTNVLSYSSFRLSLALCRALPLKTYACPCRPVRVSLKVAQNC